MTTLLTPLPPAPSRSMNPSAFVLAADTFIAAWPRLVAEFNVAAAEVEDNTVRAEAAANAAMALAGADPWVSGATYSLNEAAISQIDFQTYRRKIAGAGTTDPKNDQVNWTLVNPTPAAYSMFVYLNFGGL